MASRRSIILRPAASFWKCSDPMIISIRATANSRTNKIALAISDEHTEAEFQLDMYEVVHVFAALTQAFQDIPDDHIAQLANLPPALRTEPSYQIASSPEGDLVLIFRASPLPPFQFVFKDDAVSNLRSALREFLNIPRSMKQYAQRSR